MPKGKKRGGVEQSIITMLLQRAFPEKAEGDDEIKALRAELATLRDDQNKQTLAAMAEQIAALSNRNPIEDYQRAKATIEAIEGPSQGIVLADGSPAAQLLKDTSDKIAKVGDRVAGVMERLMLREGGGGGFVPEEAPEEELARQEDRVLSQFGQTPLQSDRSRVLRQELWGS